MSKSLYKDSDDPEGEIENEKIEYDFVTLSQHTNVEVTVYKDSDDPEGEMENDKKE